jgi:hypothetical protein
MSRVPARARPDAVEGCHYPSDRQILKGEKTLAEVVTLDVTHTVVYDEQ